MTQLTNLGSASLGTAECTLDHDGGVAPRSGRRSDPGDPSIHGGRWIARAGLTLLAVGLAVGTIAMIPRLATVRAALGHVRHAQPGWLLAGIVTTLGLSMASAVGTRAATGHRFPWHQLVEVELAATAANRLAPAGIGGVGIKSLYLCRHGMTAGETGAALAMIGLVGAALHGVSIAVTTAVTGGAVDLPLPILGAAAGIAALLLAVTIIARPGGRLRRSVDAAIATMRDIVRDPRRLGVMVASSATVTTLNVLTLGFACQAVGARASWWEIATIYLAGRAVGAAAPTPNGLGATEAALLAGFTTAGVMSAVALATVLVYRLVTFWMPIAPGLLSARRVRNRLSLLPA